MKKILFILISLFLFPTICFAGSPVSNVDFKIKQDYINVHILDNGDARVQQLLVYDGSFNGVFANITWENTSLDRNSTNYENNAIYNFDGISDFKLSAKNKDHVTFDDFSDTSSFKSFKEADYAVKGDVYKYVATYSYGNAKYTIYHATHNDSVAFLLEYTLENVVVMHPDVAEFYWQILSSDPDATDERDVRVRVYLPDSDTKETFRIWTHDILESKINYIEKDGNLIGFEATSDVVGATDQFDVRATFNKDLIKDASELDYFDGEGLSGILKVEKRRADEANQMREELKRIYKFYKTGSQVILGLLVILFVVVKFIIFRKPKVDFEAKYYREFINDYNVEVISYLFHKSINPDALSAAIMNLIYLKKVKVEEVQNEKQKKENYKFTLIDSEGLDETNKTLIDFLFNKVGNGTEFTTKGLKSYAASLSTGNTFNTSYTKWNHEVIKDGKNQGFYKSKVLPVLITIVFAFISFIFVSSGISRGVDYELLYFDILAIIFVVIAICASRVYTERGTLHLKKWNAFKNFLKDFGTFDVKELPEIALWERYLVYATVFGIAKKVQKDMNVRIKEIGDYTNTTYSDTFTHLYIYDSIRSSFSTAIADGRKSYAASRAAAYSSSSSGGGFGGGGSFGGGSGGGGGSHGGF